MADDPPSSPGQRYGGTENPPTLRRPQCTGKSTQRKNSLHGSRWRVGGLHQNPRSRRAHIDMNRMALTVIDQLDLLFRTFTAVFHLDPILSSSIAKGQDVTWPALRNHGLD